MIFGILLSKLLNEILNKTDKQILAEILNSNKTASKLVSQSNIPNSTIWSSLRKLRKLGLIDFGDEQAVEINPVVAQLVERSTVVGNASTASSNREVAGASPAHGTNKTKAKTKSHITARGSRQW